MEKLQLEDYTSILQRAKSKGKTVLLLTRHLREHQYVFLTDKVIEELKLPIKLKPEHHQHAFMVIGYPSRPIGRNKYDTTLSFAVKLVGQLSEEVHIYMNGRYFETWTLPLGRKKANFKKVKATLKFPKEMSYDLRAQWRKEDTKVKKNPEYVAPKWYNRWKPQIKLIIKKD